MTALLEAERGWNPLNFGVMPEYEEILMSDGGEDTERFMTR
uniref:Uncharacterized protein n=1 Tax=Setaria italica TaxID=4555 RepID=K3XUM6_SETIT